MVSLLTLTAVNFRLALKLQGMYLKCHIINKACINHSTAQHASERLQETELKTLN